jgi:hypothetical protein
MPHDNRVEPRNKRLTILLTKKERAELIARADLVSLSVWVRSLLFGPQNHAVPEATAQSETSPPVTEEPITKERRATRRGNSVVKQIEDVTHEVIRKSVSTCSHKTPKGHHCWQCGGKAKVEG